jgi:hypothetical protein
MACEACTTAAAHFFFFLKSRCIFWRTPVRLERFCFLFLLMVNSHDGDGDDNKKKKPYAMCRNELGGPRSRSRVPNRCHGARGAPRVHWYRALLPQLVSALFSRSIPSFPLSSSPSPRKSRLRCNGKSTRVVFMVGLYCLYPFDPLTLHRVSLSANTQDRHQGPGVLQAPSPSSLFIDSQPVCFLRLASVSFTSGDPHVRRRLSTYHLSHTPAPFPKVERRMTSPAHRSRE